MRLSTPYYQSSLTRPMAETLRERQAKYKAGSEAGRKQSTDTSTSIVWGDEQA